MTNRDGLSALLAAALALPAAVGLAQTPCDLLPTTNKASRVDPVLCQPCPGGPPVPGVRVAGVGLDYVTEDGKRWQCELFRGNRGTGDCKKLTTCLPGGERFFDNGVYKCRYQITLPGPSNPREDCERKLPLSISTVDNDRGLHILFQGQNVMFVKGTGAGNATSGEMTGGIAVTVGELFRRLGSRSVCLPPNCQDVKLDVPAAAVGSNQTLTLYTPHRYKSATASLYVSAPRTSGPSAAAGKPVLIVKAGAPAATPTPTPQQARNQSYSASLGCPGGQTSSTRVFQSVSPSPVFEVRNPQGVQATAVAQWLNTRTIAGVPICTWTEAYQFKITARDGQGDVTVSWTPQHTGNYYNPLTLSATRTITLSKGKWQIVPDATFPPDFTYSVSFRD